MRFSRRSCAIPGFPTAQTAVIVTSDLAPPPKLDSSMLNPNKRPSSLTQEEYVSVVKSQLIKIFRANPWLSRFYAGYFQLCASNLNVTNNLGIRSENFSDLNPNPKGPNSMPFASPRKTGHRRRREAFTTLGQMWVTRHRRCGRHILHDLDTGGAGRPPELGCPLLLAWLIARRAVMVGPSPLARDYIGRAVRRSNGDLFSRIE